jgi:hypothetical protein
MESLVALILLSGLLLAAVLRGFEPISLSWVAERVRGREPVDDGRQPWGADTAGDSPGEAEMTVEWGLFTREFIHARLDALVDELERLDDDPDIFAKAFHTMVARSAYEALLVDASRASPQPCLQAGQILEFDVVGPSSGALEELEF